MNEGAGANVGPFLKFQTIMILYNLSVKTPMGSKSIKMFITKPTAKEVAKELGIPEREFLMLEDQIDFLLIGGSMSRIVDESSGTGLALGRSEHTYTLVQEEYFQHEAEVPEMDSKAWEEAYRAAKLQIIDKSVQLAKLKSNWIEFSEHIAKCYNTVYGCQIEMYTELMKGKQRGSEWLEDMKPKDKDRDRFFQLLNYLDPDVVDPSKNQ